jgi:hypothetical protein
MEERLEAAAMSLSHKIDAQITRAQRILFAVMLIAAITMAAILIRLRERTQDRMQAMENAAPLSEPVSAEPEAITLLMPNDMDGSLAEEERHLPMPQDEAARARVLLETLLHSFQDPHSTHPIAAPKSEGGDGTTQNIHEIYFMPIPQTKEDAQMAVVDLSASFVSSHPSGIEPETLTLLAILGTLHANLPKITQVRFLVDGRQQETLAGHADLTRTYLAADTATRSQ